MKKGKPNEGQLCRKKALTTLPHMYACVHEAHNDVYALLQTHNVRILATYTSAI